MSRIRLAIAGISAAALALLGTGAVSACSPPFEPSIEAPGPRALVVVGTIGERVDGGRLFHVARSWNGGAMGTPILIAFKEGEPIGDCSYP